jgi:SmpA / OmlA family
MKQISIQARRWATTALTLSLLALLPLTACDRASQLEEGLSTEVQVRKEFGEPATVVVQPDGSRAFEYPRQPEGWTNYLIKIGPDGKVVSVKQLLTQANFDKVTPGLTTLEVRNILGRPAAMQRFDLKKEEAWDWRFKSGNDSKLFSVTFDSSGRALRSAVIDEPPKP